MINSNRLNGLMIAALAKAGQVFSNQMYLQKAAKAANFILSEMLTQDGILYHRYAKGERVIEGFLDDYAFVTFGLLNLYEATYDKTYLQAAMNLTNTMVTHFWDSSNGGFYSPRILQRTVYKT